MNSIIFPYWTDDALYYFQQTETGASLLRVDTLTGTKSKILDYSIILDALSAQLKRTAQPIPLDKFSITEHPVQLHFTYEERQWSYDIEKDRITFSEIIPNALKSPDEKWDLIVDNYNLVLSDLNKNFNHQITTDGQRYHDYASSPETNTRAVTYRLEGTVLPPVALWPPDSSKIITHKLDQRRVIPLYLLQNAPEGKQRPMLHSYHMSFSGDADLPLAELMIIDAVTKKMIPLKTEAFLSPYLTPLEFKWVWWSEDSKKIYFLREARGSKELTLLVADASTGETNVLITETSETYVEPSQLFLWPPKIIILDNSIVWLSERSGYSHVYLYEIGSNHPKHAITQGEWCVSEVYFYDKENGSELECLTPENAHHTINIAPSKRCFIDTYSTIDTAPISQLKAIDGKVICTIETADIQGLKKLNWIPPKRFSVKGRDGKTPIYGNLYFPSHFNPNKKYPIIDHIYPGPQVYRTSPHFSIYGLLFRSTWIAQALAELGFIVLHMDGFGTPGRSKAFHDATYKNMSDCGIPDHVATIKQLAEKFNFIDIEKVGVTGFSGGGYAAARAMLMYPEFFKVGVSAAGNHDLRCYPASYGEKYNSLDVVTYPAQSNAAHAEQLKGKLLLIHGEIDDNVHPCATLQFVDALIKHNKNFDMLIMPNQNHRATFDHPYYMRRQWDYFVQHVLGESPPANYSIQPMPIDFMQVVDW